MKISPRQIAIVKKYCWPIYAFIRLILNKDSYLHRSGWVRSLQLGRPSDSEGRPVPWMNYAIIHLLQERLSKELVLFEYGSGFSTKFYADQVKKVYSIEYDSDWFETVCRDLPNNASVRLVNIDEDGDYARSIYQIDEPIDIVIVDGRDRVNCMRHAMDAISRRGVIILDDSRRQKYSTAFAMAKQMGFRHLRFEGLSAGDDRFDEATVFYRTENCLGI